MQIVRQIALLLVMFALAIAGCEKKPGPVDLYYEAVTPVAIDFARLVSKTRDLKPKYFRGHRNATKKSLKTLNQEEAAIRGRLDQIRVPGDGCLQTQQAFEKALEMYRIYTKRLAKYNYDISRVSEDQVRLVRTDQVDFAWGSLRSTAAILEGHVHRPQRRKDDDASPLAALALTSVLWILVFRFLTTGEIPRQAGQPVKRSESPTSYWIRMLGFTLLALLFTATALAL